MNELLLLVESKEGLPDKATLELIGGGIPWLRIWVSRLQP